jgi:hypothetical protein
VDCGGIKKPPAVGEGLLGFVCSGGGRYGMARLADARSA